MANKALLTINNLKKSYGSHLVLQNVDLSIYRHEFIAFVGKSGGGKSTLLRMIAGLEQPDSGKIRQHNQIITKMNVHSRMMFQEDRLLNWMSVLENVAFAVKKT